MSDLKGIFYRDFANSYIPNILKEIYTDRVYKRFIEDKETPVIMDVGANIGLFTQYAYDHATKIYSLEPSSEHFEVLTKMIEFNGLGDKVTPIKKALSHENGKALFYKNPNVTMFSLRQEFKDPEKEAEEVETITMDKLFTQYNIDHVDFLKLDVEGSESEIVGGKGFENVADKIKAMLVEYHSWGGVNASQLYTTLRDYGFEVFQISSDATLFGAVRDA